MLRSIDKFDKVGAQGVRALLTGGRRDESGAEIEGVGLTDAAAAPVLAFLSSRGADNAATLANLAAGRYAVVVSRLAALGEAGDDHQRELAEELAARGLAMHRAPEEITVDDLLATIATTIRRVPDVPPFELS